MFKKPWTFVILNYIDIVLTLIGLHVAKVGGFTEYLYEGNKLFYLLEGPEYFVVVKLAIATIITFLIVDEIIKEKLRVGLNIGMFAVCVSNALVLTIIGIIYLSAFIPVWFS